MVFINPSRLLIRMEMVTGQSLLSHISITYRDRRLYQTRYRMVKGVTMAVEMPMMHTESIRYFIVFNCYIYKAIHTRTVFYKAHNHKAVPYALCVIAICRLYRYCTVSKNIQLCIRLVLTFAL